MRIQNLSHTRGDQFDVTVEFDQDISAFLALRLTIRERYLREGETDSTASAQATGVIVDATHVRFVIEHSVMLGLTKRRYVYDVQGTSSAGKPYTAVRGDLVVGDHATFTV
jgi:hypothetical protein